MSERGNNITDGKEEAFEATAVNLYLILCSGLTFCLHVGLILMRTDLTRERPVFTSLAAKSVFNFFVAAIVFYYIGFMFAYGAPANGFIGYGNSNQLGAKNLTGGGEGDDGSPDADTIVLCLFRIMQAATTSVIVLSVTSNRISWAISTLSTIFVIGFIYPTVVHWCWSEGGWLKTGVGTGLSYRDSAGAGVIHVTAGAVALVCCYFFHVKEDHVIVHEHVSPTFTEIVSGVGFFLTTVGFLGLNCGSQLQVATSESAGSVAMIAINTIMTAAVCGVSVAMVISFYLKRSLLKSYDITLKAGVCGMVAASAGSSNVYPWFSAILGLVTAAIFLAVRTFCKTFFTKRSKDFLAVHIGGAIAGVVITPLMEDRSNKNEGQSVKESEISSYMIILWNFFGVVVIFLWTAMLSVLCFWLCSRLKGYRFCATGPAKSEHSNDGSRRNNSFVRSSPGTERIEMSGSQSYLTTMTGDDGGTVTTTDMTRTNNVTSTESIKRKHAISWIFRNMGGSKRKDADDNEQSNADNVKSKTSIFGRFSRMSLFKSKTNVDSETRLAAKPSGIVQSSKKKAAHNSETSVTDLQGQTPKDEKSSKAPSKRALNKTKRKDKKPQKKFSKNSLPTILETSVATKHDSSSTVKRANPKKIDAFAGNTFNLPPTVIAEEKRVFTSYHRDRDDHNMDELSGLTSPKFDLKNYNFAKPQEIESQQISDLNPQFYDKYEPPQNTQNQALANNQFSPMTSFQGDLENFGDIEDIEDMALNTNLRL